MPGKPRKDFFLAPQAGSPTRASRGGVEIRADAPSMPVLFGLLGGNAAERAKKKSKNSAFIARPLARKGTGHLYCREAQNVGTKARLRPRCSFPHSR